MKFRREVVKQLLMTKFIKILSMPSFTWTGQNLKKMLTNDKTHDIISELRREIQHRTLTNKQQCNPENSK